MELRHLRFFIAAAEEGSLTLAAKKRLHTAQPSLSRQIRDLEYEVGVKLISRSRGDVQSCRPSANSPCTRTTLRAFGRGCAAAVPWIRVLAAPAVTMLSNARRLIG
jgi:hypothetical protein